ncbi:MAG: tetratricopeptide repeat protein [Betaproteobacteria bacterium]
MSLLLDALKRAEEAKRAKLSIESVPADTAPAAGRDAETEINAAEEESAETADESHDFRLEDYKEVIPARVTARSSRSGRPPVGDLPAGEELSLETIPDTKSEEQRLASTPNRVTSTLHSKLEATSLDAAQSRDTARNVFVAKQAVSPADGSRKKWLLPAIGVIALAVAGGGWYVWYEINHTSRPTTKVAARPISAPALAPAQPSTGQPGIPQQAEAPAKPEVPVEAPLPPLLPPPAELAPLPALAPRMPAKSDAPLTDREALAKSLREAPAGKEAPVELKLARSIESAAVSAELESAYAALRNADYPRARTLYANLVIADPLSIDAQLGMATALARSGDSTSAARHYRQALAIDPRNGVALAGLLAVSESRSPSLEIELRTLVGRNPDTSSLRFTLGNLYASERRWVEAQQAYFEAYRLESGNADYMYNLAVSLDHLKQPKLALNYYQKAVAAKSKSGGQFDPAAVARRINELTADSRSN